ncbi:MAG: hypothetical protein V4549_09990 [Bacteroidota bacterium]
MFDIFEYKEKIKSEYKLRKAIIDLLGIVVKEKKFRFTFNELSFDTAFLIRNNILICSDSTNLDIGNSALFYLEFLDYYLNKYSFNLSENADENFQFIEKIEDELKITASTQIGFYQFFRQVKGFLLFRMQNEFDTDLNKYILTLNNESGQILYDFNSAYCLIVPYLTIPASILFENLKHLMITLTNDTMYNSNTGDIGIAIRKYCNSNIVQGKALLQYSIKNEIPVIHNLNIPMIGGIYEIERNLFWDEIVQYYKTEENKVSIICALASTIALTNEEATEYYELIDTDDNPNLYSLLNLPKFYTSIINNKNVTNNYLKSLCFDKLKELIVNPAQKVRGTTLWEIRFIDEYDIEKVRLLKSLIQTEDFDKKQLKSIGDVFTKHKDLPSFIIFLRLYIEKFKIDFEADFFYSVIYYFYKDVSENFSVALVELLTDDVGEIRYLAHKIIEHIELHNHSFKLATNVLHLDELTQYKLWVSVLSKFKEPKKTLPILIPLIDSSFPFVQEAFIYKLELLTEEYGSSVIDLLKTTLDLNNLHHNAVINRVTAYDEAFYKNISKRNAIKELNPFYTQGKWLRLHSENYDKAFNQKHTEETNKRSSFLQFVNKVTLAKSGGWKHEKHKKVSKLTTIGASMVLPRSMFITPELIDWEFRVSIIENWKNKFEEWEATV